MKAIEEFGVDLSVDFCGVKFPNPFLLASAPPAGTGAMIAEAFEAGWGGAVIKTLGKDAEKIIHNVAPRYAALHTDNERMIGFENIELITDRPLSVWLDEMRELRRRYPRQVLISSIMAPGTNEAEWKELAEASEETGCQMIECNLGCPHGMPEMGMGSVCSQDPKIAGQITKWVKEATTIPIIMKLTPNVTDIKSVARACRDNGADSVSAINTVLGLTGIDIDTFAPIPNVKGKSCYGGYSGLAVKPIALRIVSEIANMDGRDGIAIPISGIGGMTTWADCVEFLAVGATTVQLCTSVMKYGFRIVEDLREGLARYMLNKGFDRVDQIIGRALPNIVEHSELDKAKDAKAVIDAETCTKCGNCVIVCRDSGYQAIELHKKNRMPLVALDDCTGCSLCEHACPVPGCISLIPRGDLTEAPPGYVQGAGPT